MLTQPLEDRGMAAFSMPEVRTDQLEIHVLKSANRGD